MKDPNEGAVETVEKFGVDNQKSFQIETSKKAFEILSSGIYSNKTFAIIRELACNAADAHISAGKSDVPFMVHLPNSFEPYLSVQDYGTGLSDEDVQELYTTYFSSTKNDSNDFIGSLGLGSKSPFSYTNTFTVTSVYQGVQRIYSAFLDSDGTPSISKLAEQETDEPNGVTVQVPVESSVDMSRFKNEAMEALRWFSPEPVVVGVNNFELLVTEYYKESTNWGLRGKRDPDDKLRLVEGRATIIQGRIEYPIESEPLQFESNERYIERLLQLPLDIRVPIGTVGVAASREALSYDPVTIDNIKQHLKQVYDEIINSLNEKLKEAPTLWEATKVHSDFIAEHAAKPSIRQTLRATVEDAQKNGDATWRGFNVPQVFNINLPYNHIDDLNITLYERSGNDRPRRTDVNNNINIRPVDGVALIVDNLKKGAVKRIAHYLDTNRSISEVYLIRKYEDAPDEYHHIISKLGHPPVYKASELEEPPDQSSRRGKVTLRRYRFRGNTMSSRWDEHNLPSFEDGGTYVIFNRFRVMNPKLPDRTPANPEFVFDMLDSGRSLGIMPEPVYGITKSDRSKFEQADQWYDYFDLLADRIRNDQDKFQRLLQLTNQFSSMERSTSMDEIAQMFSFAYKQMNESPDTSLNKYGSAYAFVVEQLDSIIDRNSQFYQLVSRAFEISFELEQIRYQHNITGRDVSRIAEFANKAKILFKNIQQNDEYEDVIEMLGKSIDDHNNITYDNTTVSQFNNQGDPCLVAKQLEQAYPMLKYLTNVHFGGKWVAYTLSDIVDYINLIDQQE